MANAALRAGAVSLSTGGTERGDVPVARVSEAASPTASSEPVLPSPPSPSLASLLDQARAAQAELAEQPLPITNHHHRFLMNLFGG